MTNSIFGHLFQEGYFVLWPLVVRIRVAFNSALPEKDKANAGYFDMFGVSVSNSFFTVQTANQNIAKPLFSSFLNRATFKPRKYKWLMWYSTVYHRKICVSGDMIAHNLLFLVIKLGSNSTSSNAFLGGLISWRTVQEMIVRINWQHWLCDWLTSNWLTE